MKRRGYDERFAVCLTACTSTMGAVIPPSILMVVYGATAGVSIGALLIGGILPGVLMGLSLMVQSHFFAVKYDFPREHPRFLGLRAVWNGLKAAGWPLGVPVIIVAGMVGGVFTPTESASIAAVYSLFVTLFVLKTLRWRAAAEAVRRNRDPVLAGAVLPRRRVDLRLAARLLPGAGHGDDFITSFTRDRLVIMLLIVLVNVLLGTFMDALPAILIFVPIIHPLAVDGRHPPGAPGRDRGDDAVLRPAHAAAGHGGDDRLRGRRRADDAHPEAAAPHDDPAAHRHHPVRARALDRARPPETAGAEMAMTVDSKPRPSPSICPSWRTTSAACSRTCPSTASPTGRTSRRTRFPALGKLQMQAGAVGITCQKLGEVEVFTDAGVADDVLLTFNILGGAKTDRLMALSKRLKRLAVVLDNETVAKGLSEAAVRHGRDVPFLVECDTGMGRNGVQTPQAALDLARAAMKLPGMHFEGLMTFPLRAPGASLTNPKLSAPGSLIFFEQALRLFKQAGIPVPVVSGGGTPAIFSVTGLPDADRAPRRHLPLQRRHDRRVGHRHLGQLRDARARDGGEPADRGSRGLRLRHQGAHLRPVHRHRLRPRHGVSRRGDSPSFGGARRYRLIKICKKSPRSAK